MLQPELNREPRFSCPDVDAYLRVLEEKAGFQYDQHQMYFRDGFPELDKLEAHVASLVGMDRGHTLLTNSGMSAIVTALEVALPTKGDVVLHGIQGYNQTEVFFTKALYRRGVETVAIDSGSLSGIDEALKKYNPKLILFETVINGPAMSVLDVEGFLGLPALQEINPLVILDNTFPTNSNLPLATFLQETDRRVIGVESATKSYAHNQELGGIIFTYDELCLQDLYEWRRMIGTTLGPSAVDKITENIPPTKEQFDKEHRLATKNTLLLAQSCAEVGSDRFSISYPNLPNHPNYEFANKHFSEGAAPAFFIQPTWPDLSSVGLARVLQESGVLKNCHLAQSFCFDKTGVSFDAKGRYLRVAGGLEDTERLDLLRLGFKEALSAFTES